uniref:Uncharacterized protein n=1 Tax=Anguilla anguilla TaxID=7936 RepID=A0A0E9RNH5_ANGAN
MSDSWVSKDWMHCPERMSHTLAFLSQPPETKVLPVSEGAKSRQRTSAAWPWKLCSSCPLPTSHRAHVPSPLDVRICMSEFVKLHADR